MKKLAALVFPGFQTLDFFGPIEMLGGLPDEIEITLVAETLDPVPSVHGHKILPEKKLQLVMTMIFCSFPVGTQR